MPFKWAIKRSPVLKKIDLQEDIPSICAQKLKYKQVDLALIPVALLPELDTYFIETNYCIGSNGQVDSVKLFSQVPLNEIKTITLDYQSKSSITLTKVLVKFFWKLNVQFLEARPGFEKEVIGNNAAVVIGDRTFGMNGNYPHEFDLAVEWKKMTGLPFVFAAWVSTEKLPENFIREFNAVLKYGVDHTLEAVDSDYNLQNLSKEKTIEYLTERINYDLDAGKLEALKLFLEYIGKL